MTRTPKGAAPKVMCPRCGKPGALSVCRKPCPQLKIFHQGHPRVACYLSQTGFPELYQALFPITLSPRMEKIMEATRPR